MRVVRFGWGLRLAGSEGILWRRRGFTEGGRWVDGGAGGGRALKSQMRGNCFESEQIWWSEIRADDGGGGVIRIRVAVGLWRE